MSKKKANYKAQCIGCQFIERCPMYKGNTVKKFCDYYIHKCSPLSHRLNGEDKFNREVLGN